MLDLYPMVKPVRDIVGLLIEYDMPAYREVREGVAARFRHCERPKPPTTMVMATCERARYRSRQPCLLSRRPGKPGRRGRTERIDRCSTRHHDVQLPRTTNSSPTTGRRLAYARQLTDGTHPFTARVFVNRVWLQLFRPRTGGNTE